MPFFLGLGKPALVDIGNLNNLLVLGFDETTFVGKALQAIRACGCDGGVEGGVSSSSDDEKESEQEEVSEVREGVRETGGLAAGGNDGSVVGKAVVLNWRFGSAAILRLRGLLMDFADETISVFCDWDKPDVLAATGDKSGDGSGFLDPEAQVYLRLSGGLRSASEVVTDILPKRAGNEDTSTLQFVNGFLFLEDGVSLN
jgi:hypothetical protein